MTNYRHKTTGRSAEKISNHKYKLYVEDCEGVADFFIPALLIENSSDREPIVERDWIDHAFSEYSDLCYSEECEKAFRRAIENHAPKQKIFTEKKCLKWAGDKKMASWNGHRIADFLRDHGLLSDDE